MVRLEDILEEIVGDIPVVNELTEKEIVKRDDGTFLVDGLVSVEEFKEFVEIYPDAEFSQAAHDHISQLREKEAENNFLIARFYEKQKKYTAARIYYSTVVEDYKNTSWAPKALEKLRDLNTKISQHL